MPGWAWGVLGLLLGVVVILVAPKFLKSDGGDGFFRPQPNPDAQPAAVTAEEESVAPEGNSGAKPSAHADADAADPKQAKAGKNGKEGSGYDFYTLLPGKEVEMSDAELAATEAAEEQRRAAQQRRNPQTAVATPATAAATVSLPRPVDTIAPAAQPPAQVASATPPSSVTPKPPAVVATQGPAPAAATTASATTATAAAPAAASDNTRYLLQAGAFQASGQAEEMKAKIAMLGLGARVESAQISGRTVYRVRMGPYGTAGDLADAKRKLADGGLPGMAIKVQ
nr:MULTISPECIES: SPOR domain-containing protein [unclassified Lysobacter]